MAIDVELKTLKQNNTSWPLTFKASNRFPIVANRVFATLENAQAYIDDTAADASAYPGIVLAVVQDEIAKNNGVYYVQSVAMAEGESGVLVKVGGTETETTDKYSEAVELSKTLVVGQLIKVANDETIGELTYQAGFYIVEGAGVISALATSTGSDDEVGALKTRVTALETDKVDKVEGSRLMTDAEGTKLAGIAEGAQVNYVQSVGDNLDVDIDGKLTVNLSSKVDKTDYNKKVGEIDAAILTKADLTEFTTHTANTAIHVTGDEKAAWNTAEGNAKAYTDIKISELDSKYDVLGAAASAEAAAKKYTDDEIAKLSYDENGAAASALTDAKAYVDGKVDGKFDTVGSAAAAEAAAKAYADGLAGNYDAVGSAAAAEAAAKAYADGLAGNYDAVGSAAAAEAAAKAYADGLAGNYDAVGSAAAAEAAAKAYADGLAGNYDAAGSAASALTDAKKYTDDEITAAFNNFATAVTSDEVVNTYKELIDYAASHGAEFTELVGEVTNIDKRVEDLEGINHDAYKAADEKVLSDAKAYADGLAVNYDAAGSAAAAEAAAKAYADGLAGNYDAVGSAAAAEAAAKAYVDGKVDGKFDTVGSAAAAEAAAKAYVDAISADTRLFALEGINHDAYIAADEALENKLQGNINTLSSGLSDEVSARESLADIVGTPAKGDTESVMTKLAALAEGKLNATATINGQSFVENAAIIDAGDIKLNEKTNSYEVTLTLQSVIADLDNRITSAVSGGLTSVAAGNGISVSVVAGNSQTISLKRRESDTNAVVIDENGIYVEQIMVSGNDIEE